MITDTNIYKNEFTGDFDKDGNPLFSYDICCAANHIELFYYRGDDKICTFKGEILGKSCKEIVNTDYDENNTMKNRRLYILCYFDNDGKLLGFPRISNDFFEIYNNYYVNFNTGLLEAYSELKVIPELCTQKIYKIFNWYEK